jgi:hypothetical protein
MRPSYLAPDNPDLGPSNLLVSTVHVGNLLSQVESEQLVSVAMMSRTRAKTQFGDLRRIVCAVDALDFHKTCRGMTCPAATLITEMTTPSTGY